MDDKYNEVGIEIEADGFITRMETLEKINANKAKPASECKYPMCEECDQYHGHYCTVPIVVSKQMWLGITEVLQSQAERLNRLESDVFILMVHNPEALKESV